MESVIIKIRNELIRSISGIDAWFDKDDALLDHKPSAKNKCVRELLEDVMHSNRHLLMMIDGARKSAATKELLDVKMGNYSLQTHLLDDAAIQNKLVFKAMTSGGSVTSLAEVRYEIREQLDRCLIHLELLLEGRAPMFKTNLMINDMGELDVYQSIYFMAVHTRRYLGELEGMLLDFNQTTENA